MNDMSNAPDVRALGRTLAASALGKPRLLVDTANPDETVERLRDAFAAAGRFYDRGTPVRLGYDHQAGGMVAVPLTPDGTVREAHGICRPYRVKLVKDGVVEVEVDVPLPKTTALMWLDWRGDWQLPPLNGIASAPLLDETGAIHAHDGYHAGTGMWCESVPDVSTLVPSRPTRTEAEAALLLLRRTLRTFAFKDASMVPEPGQDVPVVDTTHTPGADETAALHALLTAVCRPSLHLAPGFLIRAALQSGAGTGKGLLARVVCAIAFGRAPAAVAGGGTPEEFEKRIGAMLMGGGPMLFLDNLNAHALKSDTLASAITERPAQVRVLGKSLMVLLNATAFVVLTGNGLTATEDLARRFITCELDAGREDPEARRFRGDLLADVARHRPALLAAALTVWRWGRQEGDKLPSGMALGSFEQWCRWVRDPLLALGCLDPAARVAEAKQRDGRRQHTAELFAAWHRAHGSRPVKAAELDAGVAALLDPQGRGRQYVAAALGRLDGTRAAGFVLTCQRAAGVWGAASYALRETGGVDPHREHRGAEPVPTGPMTPMPPMPNGTGDNATFSNAEDATVDRGGYL